MGKLYHTPVWISIFFHERSGPVSPCDGRLRKKTNKKPRRIFFRKMRLRF
ncbi:hypothetical protein HOLDEFILI_03711 [Holdemania filiformis DSM 12042]|uniref:Uncharacterized protein n=1 Tax=Holdemania filiformis DSM 12042 TaxID=545696 RepID=B9YCZ8_9FIRM|nr:hypothetical protein HOLDEFILI_03711 [Holdemania filiformis DSM 12042]